MWLGIMVKYLPEETILSHSNKDPQHLHLGSEGFGMTRQDCNLPCFSPPALPAHLIEMCLVYDLCFKSSVISLIYDSLTLFTFDLYYFLLQILSPILQSQLTPTFPSVAIIVLLINVPSFPHSLSFCLFNLVLIYCFSLFYTKCSHTSLHHLWYLLLLFCFSL